MLGILFSFIFYYLVNKNKVVNFFFFVRKELRRCFLDILSNCVWLMCVKNCFISFNIVKRGKRKIVNE